MKKKIIYKKQIFIAYNTDSLVWELTLQNINKYNKLSKDIQNNESIKDLMAHVYKEKNISKQDIDIVSEENEKLRIRVFKQIKNHLRVLKCNQCLNDNFKDCDAYYKNVCYSYYMDILDESWKTTLSLTHYTKNKQTIKQCDAVLFVIASEETSFWQLQEAYFASFYNKPIIYVTTGQFLKLVAKHRLHKYIEKKLKSIDDYAKLPFRPASAQRSKW